MTHLDEYDRTEWWDVCKKLRPDISEEEFNEMWEEFVEVTRRREMH